MQKFKLSKHSTKPIYEQLVSQFSAQILSGKLAAQEKLPSIRSLAKETNTSVITIKRTYAELEKNGYIYTVPGKGSYVVKQALENLQYLNKKKVEEKLIQAAKLGEACGLSEMDLMILFGNALKKVNN